MLKTTVMALIENVSSQHAAYTLIQQLTLNMVLCLMVLAISVIGLKVLKTHWQESFAINQNHSAPMPAHWTIPIGVICIGVVAVFVYCAFWLACTLLYLNTIV